MSLFVSFSIYGQKNIDYINKQVQNIETSLLKKGENLKLTNQQLNALAKIFEEKYTRVEVAIEKFKDKLIVSQEITKIEDEFSARVASVLTVDQRISLQKDERKKIMPTSSK